MLRLPLVWDYNLISVSHILYIYQRGLVSHGGLAICEEMHGIILFVYRNEISSLRVNEMFTIISMGVRF